MPWHRSTALPIGMLGLSRSVKVPPVFEWVWGGNAFEAVARVLGNFAGTARWLPPDYPLTGMRTVITIHA